MFSNCRGEDAVSESNNIPSKVAPATTNNKIVKNLKKEFRAMSLLSLFAFSILI